MINDGFDNFCGSGNDDLARLVVLASLLACWCVWHDDDDGEKDEKEKT